MNRKKLGTCIAASLITLGGTMYLAGPAYAASTMKLCSPTESAYAQGYSDGICQSYGFSGGTVTSCTESGGTFTFNFTCY